MLYDLKLMLQNTSLTTYNITDKGTFGEGHFIEFKVMKTGTLTITKFHDYNANGMRDPGEPGLKNRVFSLRSSSGETGPKETDSNGQVQFEDLEPGNYTIFEKLPDGWNPSDLTTAPVEVIAEKTKDVLVGNYVPPVIDILKFEDRNADGVKGPSEPGISGWNFIIKGPEGFVKNDKTDRNGELHLDRLVPGEYTIIEEERDCWIATTPTIQSRILNSEDKWNTEFGNVEGVNINITKFEDSNGNGRNDSEPGIPRWEFTVEDPKGRVTPYETDRDGKILIECVIPGEYTAREKERPEWEPTTPTVQRRDLKPGEDWAPNFGNKPTTLDILKFEDSNANGVQDAGEMPLPDWDFSIKGPDGIEVPKTTDAVGRISLKAITPGEYLLREVPREGWVSTTPIVQDVTLMRGDRKETIFGNTQNFVNITKFEDRNGNGVQDSGEVGLQAWDFMIKDPQGRELTRTTDENGFILYIYTVPGEYEVEEVLKDGWYNTTPRVQQVSLVSGPKTLYFGNDRYRTLTPFKFEDFNENGAHDSGEKGLPGWEFMITNNRTDETVEVYANDTGFASWNELRVDREYKVSETIRVGWNNTTTLSRTIRALPGDETLREDFGNKRPPLLILLIAKFNDSNGNGIKEAGEEIIDWNFTIRDPSGETHPMTTVSGEYTKFDYTQFGFGNYTIEEELKEDSRWINTTPKALVVPITEESRGERLLLFGNKWKPCSCGDPNVMYDPGKPPWNPSDDDVLNVSKSLDPYLLDSTTIDSSTCGSKVKYEIRLRVEEKMKPTDLVLAVDTSGSMVKNGPGPLMALSDSITDFVQNNSEIPDLRIGLVSWDEDIDFILSPTDDYTKVMEEAGNFSANPAELTFYQRGVDGALSAFDRSPSSSEKLIVFITDATGNYRPALSYPEGSDYTVHMIVISPTTEINQGRRENLTSIVRPTNGTLEIVDDPAKVETAIKELLDLQLTKRTLKDVLVIDSLPGYMALHPDSDGNFSIEPTKIERNGAEWKTTTMVWEVGDLSSDDDWNVSFDALFCWRMPADARERDSSVKSEVNYVDPETGDQVSVPVPEGGIRIEPGEKSTQSATSKGIPGFSAWIGGVGLLAALYLLSRR